MFPAVPFFNLPKLRKAIEIDMPPAHHGLWNTWKEMLEIHRKQQTESGLCARANSAGLNRHQG